LALGENAMSALSVLFGVESVPDELVSAVELLQETPLSQLEQAVVELKKRHSPSVARHAMIEVFASAVLADFEILKDIYLKHCADAAS
jgi:hypothetical protein